MTMKEQLAQYYKDEKIEPVARSSYDEMFKEFRCPHKCACRKACLDAFCRAGNKKEDFLFQPHTNDPPTATTIVSPYYQDRKYHGDCIPRIVVLSLSIPQPEKEQDNKPASNPKTPLNPDEHWSRTLVTVRSLLHPFIAPEKFPKPVYLEDKNKKEVEELFVHVRTAKCCSNFNKGRQEPSKVYANCGKYLGEELSILKPDVIVTQGNNAHREAKKHAFNIIGDEKVKDLGLEHLIALDFKPLIAHLVNLKENNQRVYWLKMIFPTLKWGHMKKWDEQAGDPILSDVGHDPKHEKYAKREHLVRYGEAIKEFLKNK